MKEKIKFNVFFNLDGNSFENAMEQVLIAYVEQVINDNLQICQKDTVSV